MPKITLEISEELSQQIAQIGIDTLPELLALSLQQSPISTQINKVFNKVKKDTEKKQLLDDEF